MKKKFSLIGMIVGVAIIVLGIVVLSLDIGGGYLESTSFGGDFYTYSYRATRTAANNVGDLISAFKIGVGFLLISIGATDICVFGCKMAEAKESASPVTVKAETAEDIASELPEL